MIKILNFYEYITENLDEFDNWIIEESELNEGKSSDVERIEGGVIYRGEKFPGFNKPKKYSGPGKFKKRVLAKEGDKIKVLNYGHRDYSDFTKHKDPKRRKNFRMRHKCDPVSKLSKLTRRYWACQDLW